MPTGVKAQTCINQIGVGFFGTELIGGDIHPQASFGVKGTYTRNVTHRWAYHVDASYVQYRGDDIKSTSDVIKHRGLKYKTEFFETSAGVEMTFTPYAFENKHSYAVFTSFDVGLAVKASQKPKFGLWTSAFDAYNQSLCTTIITVVPKMSVSVGVKSKVNVRTAVSARATAVYYLSDDMDFSAPKSKYFEPSVPQYKRMIGTSGNDWGVFLEIRIDYLWGMRDCYCQ